MNTVSERLQALLNHLDWSNYRLAKEGNFSKTSVTNWITGKTQPDHSKMELIALATGASKDWLLHGEGEMLKPVIPNRSMESNLEVISTPKEFDADELYLETKNGMKYYQVSPGRYLMRVPLVPYDAYARFANECDLQPDRDEWEEVDFDVDRIGRGNYLAFAVRGDSMDDGTKKGISQGEILLARELDRIHWKDGIRYNKYPFWVIAFENSILVKQIIDQNLETGDIVCHSLNSSPEYRDFTVNLENIQRLFNVVKVKIPDKEF